MSPWRVLPLAMTPTPTPVPTVTYTKDSVTPWLPNLYYAKAQEFTSVSIPFGQSVFAVNYRSTGICLHYILGVVVIMPKSVLYLLRHSGPNDAIPTKCNCALFFD